MRRTRTNLEHSRLLLKRWRVAELITTLGPSVLVRVVRLEASDCAALEERWGPLREEPVPWNWRTIPNEANDVFGVSLDGVVVAAWAAYVPKRGGNFELRWLEVAPREKGQAWGKLALLCACVRAKEVGCDRIVMVSRPSLVDWYRGFGALVGAPGWDVEGDGVLMRIEAARIDKAKDQLDGFRDPEEES